MEVDAVQQVEIGLDRIGLVLGRVAGRIGQADRQAVGVIVGLTGVGDPGGNNLVPGDYAALFEVWRRRELTVRVSYTLGAQAPPAEFANYKALTTLLPMGFGDDWLRFNGIGERVTFGMYNNDAPTEKDKDELYAIAKWAAERVSFGKQEPP